MGARGPQPTPTKTLEARGSWRAKLNSREPRPKPGAPTCPKQLGPAEKVVWRAIYGILADMNLVTMADGSMLERYCRYFIRWRACEDFIAKSGQVYALKSLGKDGAPPKSGYVEKLDTGEYLIDWAEYPQVRESHRLHKALKDVEDRFGLTPAARTRIQALSENGPRLSNAGQEETVTKAAKFFGGQAS